MKERPLSVDARLYDVVRAIEHSRRRIAVVAAADGRLLGTLTDGDVRRCLLAGGSLQTPALDAMNANPVTAEVGSSEVHVLGLMKRANIMSVPLVDVQGLYVDLVHLTDLDMEAAQVESGFAAAVIMAGGEGTRLRPVVEGIPKPMVKIGGLPLLERQITRLARAGVRRCFISVNYLSQVIEDYFQDGRAFGVSIEYVREKEKMGTAGALALLPELPAGPVVVMNGDVLTSSDLGNLHAYHQSHQAAITVAAVDYWVQIPYGVIRSDGPFVSGLEEKPSQRFLCNAGIYAISADALARVPAQPYDMTDLMRDCLVNGQTVVVFPMHEYWSDIGTPDDLEKARAAFASRDKTPCPTT